MIYNQDVDFIITILVSIFIGFALVYTARTFSNSRKTEELRLSQEILTRLDDLNKELPKIESHSDELKIWEERLYNTLEWLGFLINHKRIRDKKIKDFFKEDVISWYEDGFLGYATDEIIKNPDKYKELKEMYKRFKEGKPAKTLRQKICAVICK